MSQNAYVLLTTNEYLIVSRYSCDDAYFQAGIHRHAVSGIDIMVLMCMRGDLCRFRRGKEYECLLWPLE